MRILSNSATFSADRPYFKRSFFRPHWPLPIALTVLGLCLRKIFGDSKYTSNYNTVTYCRLGNGRQRLSWQSCRIIAIRLVSMILPACKWLMPFAADVQIKQESAVADKPARRAASRATNK